MDEFQLETKVTQQIAIQTNIEKLDTFLEEIRNKYAGTIVTEDIVTSSKKDRANLNKIVAKLKEAKKYVEEKGKEGIFEFLEKIDSAVKEISDISNNIDVQIKIFEEEEKEKKEKLATAAKAKILAEMNIPEEIHEFIKLDSKITNKTYTLKKIEEDITIKASKIHDKYNYILKEIEKHNVNLINKITFDDVKSIFDTEISNIIPRIETTANFRRAQEEKVKEKVDKEKQEAIEKAQGKFNINDLRTEYKKLYEEKYGEIKEPSDYEKKENTEEPKLSPRDQNNKIISLTEKECNDLILHECIDIDSFHYNVIEEKEFFEDKGRWDYPVKYILERNDGKLFIFNFRRGLTEMQEDQSYEQYLKEYIETDSEKDYVILKIKIHNSNIEKAKLLKKFLIENKIEYEKL